jgi:hypothetical protein
MRQISLIFLFTIHCLLGMAQQPSPSQPPTNFKKAYHPIINQAELAIVKSSFGKALQHYQSAFAAVKTPFARDLYNAMLCAVIEKKYAVASRYVQQVLEKGGSLEYFEKNDFLKKMRQTSHWQTVKNNYPNTRQKHLASINQVYKQQLLDILAKDKSLRGKNDSYKTRGEEIKKLDQENLTQLYGLIKQYGFPSEARVGCGESLDFTRTYVIPLVHYYQRMSLGEYIVDINFSEILSNAIVSGEAAPHQVAYINGYTGAPLGNPVCFKAVYIKGLSIENSQNEKHQAIVKKAPWYQTNYGNERMRKKINEERKSLGLESIRAYQQKIAFSLKSDLPFLFNFPDATNVYFCGSPQDVIIFTKKAELLD